MLSRPVVVAGGVAALIVVAIAAVVLLSGGPSTPEVAADPPQFVEITDESGIDHVYAGDFGFFVGGGVAVMDCNGDGRQDLYLAGGENRSAVYVNQSEVAGKIRFERIANVATDLTAVTGAFPLDIDSDSNMDLVVLRLGENVAFRGDGECGFERANESWGLDGGSEWTAAFSATWENGNTWPTLAFGNYLEWPVDRQEAASCADNTLVRPEGETYGAPIALSPGWCTLSILFTDWSGSGQADLRVANDRHYYIDGSEQLWELSAGETPRLFTEDDGWEHLEIWGMGIAAHDVTGDGLPDFFVTSQGDNKLQALVDGAAGPTYDDIAIRRGVTAHRPFTGDESLPSTAWHPEFADVNNDGFVDLFISKGNVEAMAEYAMVDPNNLLLGQPDGSFVESASDAGVASTARSRGAALADFNLDGWLDLIVVNRVEGTQVWQNTSDTGNWLEVRLEQPAANRDAVGAVVEVAVGDVVVRREVTVGGGHAGGQSGWLHFGLAGSDSATVSVTWPDGTATDSGVVAANQFIVINAEGQATTASF